MKRTKIDVDKNTHIQLKYLSKVSGKPMAEILREILSSLTELSIMYRNGCTLGISNRISENTVYIVVHGVSPSFICGTSSGDAEMHKTAKNGLKQAQGD